MSQADRITGGVNARYHPVSHYSSPTDVLRDEALSASEKRIILSSWASDMYAVDSRPALRKIPGISQPVLLRDILTALRQLDEDHPSRRRDTAAAGAKQVRVSFGSFARWSREANVQRYRRLLETRLTDHERRYIEKRLAEELGETGSASECHTQ
jgi:hypothetical protein